MIYPDEELGYLLCPICNKRLTYKPGAYIGCKIYMCSNISYRIGIINYPHYEFYRFKDKSVYFQYIIPPIRITSQENESTIYFLKKTPYILNYNEKELVTRKGSMFLVNGNVEEIKDKIKMYSLFS